MILFKIIKKCNIHLTITEIDHSFLLLIREASSIGEVENFDDNFHVKGIFLNICIY